MKFKFGLPDPREISAIENASLIPGLDMEKFHVLGAWLGILLALLIILLWLPICPPRELFILLRNDKWGALIILLPVILLTHEMLHTLAFPNFGFNKDTVVGISNKTFCLYATYIGPLSRKRWIAVLLQPFIVGTVLLFLSSMIFTEAKPVLFLAAVINALGSGADVVITYHILKYIPSGQHICGAHAGPLKSRVA